MNTIGAWMAPPPAGSLEYDRQVFVNPHRVVAIIAVDPASELYSYARRTELRMSNGDTYYSSNDLNEMIEELESKT